MRYTRQHSPRSNRDQRSERAEETTQRTLRFRPRWFASPAGPRSSAVPSGLYVLVRITTLSRGIWCCLRNLPRITSDSPSEYVLAVSNVLMPLSYAYLSLSVSHSSCWTDAPAVPIPGQRDAHTGSQGHTATHFIWRTPSSWSVIIQSCPEPYCMTPRMILDTCVKSATAYL